MWRRLPFRTLTSAARPSPASSLCLPPAPPCSDASIALPRRPGPTRNPYFPAMRAVQITRFGGPEVMDVVDLPDPTPGDGEQLFDISSSGVNFADTHHALSAN